MQFKGAVKSNSSFLLNCFLVLSVFAFSGFAGADPNPPLPTSHIEVVDKQSNLDQAINFHYAIGHYNGSDHFASARHYLSIQLNHGFQFRIKLKSHSENRKRLFQKLFLYQHQRFALFEEPSISSKG